MKLVQKLHKFHILYISGAYTPSKEFSELMEASKAAVLIYIVGNNTAEQTDMTLCVTAQISGFLRTIRY